MIWDLILAIEPIYGLDSGKIFAGNSCFVFVPVKYVGVLYMISPWTNPINEEDIKRN